MQFSEFVWPLSYSGWDVFKNFLLTDATDRNKISSDQKRFFIAFSLYPLSFFVNTPFKSYFELRVQSLYFIQHLRILRSSLFIFCLHSTRRGSGYFATINLQTDLQTFSLALSLYFMLSHHIINKEKHTNSLINSLFIFFRLFMNRR